MASQAIMREKKSVLKHLTLPIRSCSSFSRLGYGRYPHETDKTTLHQAPEQSPLEAGSTGRRWDMMMSAKENVVGFSSHGFIRHRPCAGCISECGHGRQEFVLPFAVRGLAQFARTVYTATAGQPEICGEEDPNEVQTQKQFKDASPEECDQAVEGLSTAKAKQMQYSSKTAQSFISKFWAKLLGIGPALRALASMSRF